MRTRRGSTPLPPDRSPEEESTPAGGPAEVTGGSPGGGPAEVTGDSPGEEQGAGSPPGAGGQAGERRRARTVALQALYEIDSTTHDPMVVLQRRFEDDATPPTAASYARRLVLGVRDHQSAIDGLIVNAAPAWPLDQMSRVDKAVLRQAIFEMLFVPGTPPKVAINEAVELAKSFGHESAPKFVNGVLGNIARANVQRGPAQRESA